MASVTIDLNNLGDIEIYNANGICEVEVSLEGYNETVNCSSTLSKEELERLIEKLTIIKDMM